MGKKNSKLKPEEVADLKKKTYCKYLQIYIIIFYINSYFKIHFDFCAGLAKNEYRNQNGT